MITFAYKEFSCNICELGRHWNWSEQLLSQLSYGTLMIFAIFILLRIYNDGIRGAVWALMSRIPGASNAVQAVHQTGASVTDDGFLASWARNTTTSLLDNSPLAAVIHLFAIKMNESWILKLSPESKLLLFSFIFRLGRRKPDELWEPI